MECMVPRNNFKRVIYFKCHAASTPHHYHHSLSFLAGPFIKFFERKQWHMGIPSVV